MGVESVVRRTGTVSLLDIDVQKQKVQALYQDWTGAPEEAKREKLEKAVGDLKRDAAVVSDSAVAKQSEAALQAIHDAVSPQQTGVFQALQNLAPENAPETPAPQVVQLVDAPGSEVDRELLEIFLEEAREVVDTIVSNLAACRDAPHDRESLTTIRRGFHTLKGSGRMVGLMDLGEVAWQCEQVMNKWLKDEKPATPPLLDFIDLSQQSFSGWVSGLMEGGSVTIDATEIIARRSAGRAAKRPGRARAGTRRGGRSCARSPIRGHRAGDRAGRGHLRRGRRRRRRWKPSRLPCPRRSQFEALAEDKTRRARSR